MVNIKNFKKWVIPVLILLFCEFVYLKVKTVFIKYGLVSGSKILFWIDCTLIVVIVSISYFVFKGKMNSIDSSRKMNLVKAILITVILFAIEIYLLSPIISQVRNFLFGVVNNPNTNAIAYAEKNSFYAILDACIAGPIFEELLYRKVIFGYLYDLHSGCNKYIRVITSVVISSIIFGSIHNGVFHPDMIHYVTGGIILAGIYLYTKRLSCAIIYHIMFNSLIAILRFL